MSATALRLRRTCVRLILIDATDDGTVWQHGDNPP